MEETRWQRLQAIFAEARSADAAEREHMLAKLAQEDAELAAEVRSLLHADRQSGVLDELAQHVSPIPHIVKDVVPERIGAYRIIRELGRGGMGVVYHAERDDGQFRQRVAIKLIDSTDADDPLHRRFLAERRILAALQHPNIARLLDGGFLEDGRPFLVMEYIEGVPITEFCRRNKLNLRARLRLFMDVCAAVQHAHQNLIIHRDLKPGNILVSADGRVHLLDFGIARLINPALHLQLAPPTRGDLRALTPEYASPEQVRGDTLTTASDIYSLGVLLYELCCDERPYRVASTSPLELATAICTQEPLPPSQRARSHARELRGDLDSIVLMALRKEPQHRYASVALMREDIERHLRGAPVLAHRGGKRYRVRKFVRRHRAEVAAGLLVLIALSTGLSVTLHQRRRALQERDRAEQALAEAQGVTRFLLELFQTGDGSREPEPARLSALDLLNRGAQRADDLSDQPGVHAQLLDVIGQMSLHLGRFDDAQRMLERAVAVYREHFPESPGLAAALIHLAWVHRARLEVPRARELVTEALALRRRVLPPNHPDIAEAIYELGWLASSVEQEALYREALRVLPDTAATAERRIAWVQALSTNLRRQGKLEAAVATDRDALELAQRHFGPDHHVTAYAMIHLADHVRDLEQNATEAERLYRRGLELQTRHYGENSVRLIHGLHSLADLLAERGDAEAEQLIRHALRIRQTATGPEHPSLADELQRLALELARQSRLREAESLVRRALDMTRQTLGYSHTSVAVTRLPALGLVLHKQRRYAESDAVFMEAISGSRHTTIPLGQLRRTYATLLLERGEIARAEEQLLQSLELLEKSYSDQNHPNVQETKRVLTRLYEQWNKPALAERYRVPPGRFIAY